MNLPNQNALNFLRIQHSVFRNAFLSIHLINVLHPLLNLHHTLYATSLVIQYILFNHISLSYFINSNNKFSVPSLISSFPVFIFISVSCIFLKLDNIFFGVMNLCNMFLVFLTCYYVNPVLFIILFLFSFIEFPSRNNCLYFLY